MTAVKYDVIVLGAGPGGYVAAIRAAQRGMKVAIVEREHLGGICLNWGCIPTKALLRAAEIHHLLHDLDQFGLSVSDIRFDLDKIVGRSRKVAGQLAGGIKSLMKKHHIQVYDGKGALGPVDSSGARAVTVTQDDKPVATLTAQHVIIATGAWARSLPGLEPDGRLIWTYREAMVPKSLPKSLLVVGSGAIGIEFASFYRSFGVEVTVVEVMDRILPVEDEEISKLARKAFEKRGMKIHVSTTVKDLKKNADSVTATLESTEGAGSKSQEITVDRVILAIGIVGNTEGFGLEKTRARVEKTHIVVDAQLRTDEPGLYAIGDVVGPPWLAHKAMHEGVMCADVIAGDKPHALDTRNIPGCTYCTPQIASVGLTEAKARALGHEIKVGRFPYGVNGKAIAMGETEGLVKTVFDAKTGELLGAHLMGAEATELIQGYGIAKSMEATEAELMAVIFPHPTLSEAMHESVLHAYGRALHI